MFADAGPDFQIAEHRLDQMVRRDAPALIVAGVVVQDQSVRHRQIAKGHIFWRHLFKAIRERGADTYAAAVSISLNESDADTVIIWKLANIQQEHQVPWWDYHEKIIMPLEDFLTLELSSLVLHAIEKGFAASTGAIRTSSPHIATLLYVLCVDLGFCLPADETQKILNAPPSDVDEFTDAVFRAEEMDPDERPRLRNQVRERVAKYFNLLHHSTSL